MTPDQAAPNAADPSVTDTSPSTPTEVAATPTPAPATEAPAPAPVPAPVVDTQARMDISDLSSHLSAALSRIGALEQAITTTDHGDVKPGGLVRYAYVDMFEQRPVEILCLVAAIEPATDDSPERARLIPLPAGQASVPLADVTRA